MSFLVAKTYRYQGRPDWTPESAADDLPKTTPAVRAPNARQSAEAQARKTAFSAHRDEGLSIAEASALVNVTLGTGHRYEADRRAGGAA